MTTWRVAQLFPEEEFMVIIATVIVFSGTREDIMVWIIRLDIHVPTAIGPPGATGNLHEQ
jgi:hypothetical protein